MELDRKGRMIKILDSFNGAIVEGTVDDLHMKPLQGIFVNHKAVVLGRNHDAVIHIVPHRLVDAAVAKEHFLCLGPARKGHDLMPHANSKDRFLANHLLDVVDFNRKVRRVAGAI